MQGNYFHEIFTAGVLGHYLFIINEKILELIYGEEYLSIENNGKISLTLSNVNTMDNSEKNNENKDENNEMPKSKQIEIEENDNNDNSEEKTE